jgi:hypothetical protein
MKINKLPGVLGIGEDGEGGDTVAQHCIAVADKARKQIQI